MSWKTSDGNIYGSENFDPEFLEYLYQLPAEFLEELFIAWVISHKQTQIPVLDIDAIHKKKPKPISNKEIKDFYSFLKYNKVDVRKLGGKN